jgi:hypothetical protein
VDEFPPQPQIQRSPIAQEKEEAFFITEDIRQKDLKNIPLRVQEEDLEESLIEEKSKTRTKQSTIPQK